MAFISLGDALDRVLEKLAVERGEKRAGGVEPPAKVAPAEGLAIRARERKTGGAVGPSGKVRRAHDKRAGEEQSGCDRGAPAHVTLHQRWERHRDTGQPCGQGKFRRTKL